MSYPKIISHTHFARAFDWESHHEMPKEVEYFDSQASAAASLGLDIYDIREAKTQGCCAFRSGRVYRGPLLEWMEAKRAKAQKVIPPGANARRVAIAETIIAIARAFEAEAITREQYFDQTTELVEAAGDREILTGWIQNQFDWLCESFPNIADAWKEHPNVMQWLHELASFRGQRKRLKRAKS
jgi:hypothetical protein